MLEQYKCQVYSHNEQKIKLVYQNGLCKQNSKKACLDCVYLHQQDETCKLMSENQLQIILLDFKQGILERSEKKLKICRINKHQIILEIQEYLKCWEGKYKKWDYLEQIIQQNNNKFQQLTLQNYIDDQLNNIQQFLKKQDEDIYNEANQLLRNSSVVLKEGKYTNEIIDNINVNLKKLANQNSGKLNMNFNDMLQFTIEEFDHQEQISQIYEKFYHHTYPQEILDDKIIIQKINQINEIQIEQDDYDQKQFCRKGLLLQRLGNLAESLNHFDKLIEIFPQNSLAYLHKALIFIDQSKYEKAIKCLDFCLVATPNYKEAYQYKAQIFKNQCYFKKAIKCWDQCIEIDPRYEFAHYNKDKQYIILGLIYQSYLNNQYEAMKCMEKCLTENPNYSFALELKEIIFTSYQKKGDSLILQGLNDEAIQMYDFALQINPNDAEIYSKKGDALNQIGQIDKAISMYDRALQINPNDEVTYLIKGDALSQLGLIEKAINMYDRALEINPNEADTYKIKGDALNQIGQIDEDAETYKIKGVALYNLRQFGEAITINPNDAETYSKKGDALSYLGLNDEAIKMYDFALQINHKHAETYSKKGMRFQFIFRR